MNKKLLITGFVLFQVLIIAGMIGRSLLPLVTGTPVEFTIRLYDPRDLFRGNYVRLNYDLNSLSLGDIPNDLDTTKDYKFGNTLYVLLEQKGDTYIAKKITEEKPEDGELFIKGHIQYPFTPSNDSWNTISLHYGIESYYANPDRAKELENTIRDNNNEWTNSEEEEEEEVQEEQEIDTLNIAIADTIQTHDTVDTDLLVTDDNDNDIDTEVEERVTVVVMISSGGEARIKHLKFKNEIL